MMTTLPVHDQHVMLAVTRVLAALTCRLGNDIPELLLKGTYRLASGLNEMRDMSWRLQSFERDVHYGISISLRHCQQSIHRLDHDMSAV